MPYKISRRWLVSISALVGIALLVFIAVLALSGARGLFVADLSRRLGQPVRIDGAVAFHPRLSGLTLDFSDMRTERPMWPGAEALLSIAHGEVSAPWTVLVGSADLTSLKLTGARLSLQRDRAGRVNWSGHNQGRLRLPHIRALDIEHSTVTADDAQTDRSFSGDLATVGSGQHAILQLRGHGRSSGDPWSLDLRLAPAPSRGEVALNVRLGIIHAGSSSALVFNGDLQSNPGRLTGRVSSAGSNLHDFAALLKAPLFRTPPYSLHADLDATREVVKLRDLAGWIGHSDLDGNVTITPDRSGRRLDGRVHSHALRIADLFSVVSGGRLTRKPSLGHLLPDGEINPKPLRLLTGQVLYTADGVQAPTTPKIRSLTLRAVMDHGLVAADPMDMRLAHGRMTVRFTLDVRGPVPAARLVLGLHDSDTTAFQAAGAVSSPFRARLDAQIALAGWGPSLTKIADDASGHATLSSLGGEVQRLPADLLSGRFADGLIALVAHKRTSVRIRCAVAAFKVANGQANVVRLRLVTDAGAVAGVGFVDFGQQTISLALRPAAEGRTPSSQVLVSGPLNGPRVSLSTPRPLQAVAGTLIKLVHPEPPKVTEQSCG